MFYLKSFILGLVLSLDAFSVSVADGMLNNKMKRSKMLFIPIVFALFQFIMPFIGWCCVHWIRECLEGFKYAIPWIALFLLSYLGIKMIIDNRKKDDITIDNDPEISQVEQSLTLKIILVQGIATSIDALSVGFAISELNIYQALISSMLIGIITFLDCFLAIFLGKKIGMKFAKKASIIAGVVIILIGIEIFIKNLIELY